MAEDETTFLCGYQRPRRYGTTSTPKTTKPSFNSLLQHRVLPTDTLQGIALKYGSSMTEIKRLNKLWSNDSIHFKDTLDIPVLVDSDSPSTSSSLTSPTTFANPNCVLNHNGGISEQQQQQQQSVNFTANSAMRKHSSGSASGGGSKPFSLGGSKPFSLGGSSRQAVPGRNDELASADSNDKSEISVNDILSRIDKNIKQTKKNVRRLERDSTVDRVEEGGVAGSSSVQSFSNVSLGSSSPSEVRLTERGQLHSSFEKLQETHDRLYQL